MILEERSSIVHGAQARGVSSCLPSFKNRNSSNNQSQNNSSSNSDSNCNDNSNNDHDSDSDSSSINLRQNLTGELKRQM